MVCMLDCRELKISSRALLVPLPPVETELESLLSSEESEEEEDW